MAEEKELGKKAFQIIASLLIIVAVSGCSTWSGTKTGKRTGKTGKSDRTVSRGPVDKEIKRPEQKQFASISNPARKASMDVVNQGKEHLQGKKYDKALASFREAIIIDSTNGIAYYFMGKTRYYLDQYDEALGILDKAEALLCTSEQWVNAINLLRTKIEKAAILGGQAARSELIPIINVPDRT